MSLSALSERSARSASDDRHTVPFDYVFRFDLQGSPGRTISDSVTVSIEGNFVAVSIGYGVIPTISPRVVGLDGLRPRGVGFSALRNGIVAAFPGTVLSRGPDATFAAVMRSGLKLNPRFAEAALSSIETGTGLSTDIARGLFQVVAPPARDVQFLYALHDEGSGREYQSEPILNTAGLGAADGNRPFRQFPQPIEFATRTSIRMDVTEVSEFRGALHLSLQGYKVLRSATGRSRR